MQNAKAKEAFEEVERCKDELLNEERRNLYISQIEGITADTVKERKKQLAKGDMKMEEMEDENAAIERAILKGFAEIEEFKVKLKRVQEADKKRALEKEEAEKESKRKEKLLEKEFNKNRNKRVEAWQEFEEKQRQQKRYKVDTLKKEKRK